MALRRVVYRLIFPLALALPVWVLIGRGIVIDGIGWQFLVYLFVAPVLFLALSAIGGLIAARPDVRETKAVSWPDAAVLLALWLTLIAAGVFALPVLAVAAVLLLLGGFWLSVWQLARETGRRLRVAAERMRAPTGPRAAAPLDIGEVIVVRSYGVDPEPKHS